MSKRFINGTDFTTMVVTGARNLHDHAADVNALNVFPVPDGDTGTNMNLTITSAVEELKKKSSPHLGKSAELLSKGLLMGARGNSGVILSQLFRGFAKSVSGLEQAGPAEMAAAFQSGVDMAYKAVVKPVEGTILTVAKEAAKHAVWYARRATDVVDLMEAVLEKANEALANTPNLLPVLKQVGVVDSGGQGLVYIYEGFVSALKAGGASTDYTLDASYRAAAAVAEPAPIQVPKSAQAQLDTDAIEFFYDMEFFINRSTGEFNHVPFHEETYRRELAKDGDSIIVIDSGDIIKVHVHSRKPGDVFNLSMKYGELTRMNILNMRDQHRDLLAGEFEPADFYEETGSEPIVEVKPYGMIAVSMGQGISDIFSSLGVDVILSGGQTMNPSTEDFVKAASAIEAATIYIYPNNSNIILAAEQARDLVEDKQIVVIPTKTIPQGIAAALAFNPEEIEENNTPAMKEAIGRITSGQITYAVRDTQIDDLQIQSGDYLGLKNNKIVVNHPDLLETAKQLLESMIVNGDEIVTILTGADAKEEETQAIADFLSDRYPGTELELHSGGQPLYCYIFSVE
ncbi:DAK2 domain-containing protein [Paenibacillus gansuensis]|uniref:DAK2 domain-containing protein n=1 Tax=Paenibacillus gansuensis TaxID=306542 RepID=A0ABW5PD52_9BACL